MEPILAVLSPKFDHLTATWAQGGAIMAPLWALMKPSSRQLGPTKRHMEPINRDMELTWHQLGVNLGRLGAALVHLVPNLALISVQLGH